jgi:hypothetical protein
VSIKQSVNPFVTPQLMLARHVICIDDSDNDEESSSARESRLLQEAIRLIAQEDLRCRLITTQKDNTTNNSDTNAKSCTEMIPGGRAHNVVDIDKPNCVEFVKSKSLHHQFTSHQAPQPLPKYQEGQRVQVRSNQTWFSGRILFGGVRSDLTYDVLLDPVDGRDSQLERRVAENDIRDEVAVTEEDLNHSRFVFVGLL